MGGRKEKKEEEKGEGEEEQEEKNRKRSFWSLYGHVWYLTGNCVSEV